MATTPSTSNDAYKKAIAEGKSVHEAVQAGMGAIPTEISQSGQIPGGAPLSTRPAVRPITPTTPTTPAFDPTQYLGGGYKPNNSLTSFGQQYQDSVSKRIAGADPAVQAAQAQQATNASRTAYVNDKTAREASLQGGQLLPGSIQAQRGLDRAQASTSATNLAGEQDVNKLTRSSVSEGLTQANQIEQQAKGDLDKRNADLINSVQDPKARYFLNQVLASGGDVQAAYAGMFKNGTLRGELTSATPSQTKLQGIKDDLKTIHPDWTDEQVQAEAIKQLSKTYDQTTKPIDTATLDATEKQLDAMPVGSRIDWTTPENKAVLDRKPDTQLSQFNNDPKAQDAWASANAGKWVKINGKPYKVSGSNFSWQKDAAGNQVKGLDVLDENGNKLTLGPDGNPTLGAYSAVVPTSGTPATNTNGRR